ncbi:MAG: PSD1 domain-containing protein [Verrucomicrobia bacterium]|nr:PSD1 domain-containing protein [Verrucomicrobiota bacterium]
MQRFRHILISRRILRSAVAISTAICGVGALRTIAEPNSLATPRLSQHDVIPIFLRHCTACHGAQQQEAKLDLRSKLSMLKGGKSGPALVPGNPATSRIVQRIQSGECPPSKRLVEASVKPVAPSSLAKLTEWIEAGAPETPEEPDLAGTPDDPLVREKDREFWSFQPPKFVLPPPVRQMNLLRNPIDAFILHKLEEKELTFAPEAARATLLRRVCFDLTGLPPSPEETTAFLSDHSPDAYERLIDRLLASPRYGERWGRHWLDVAGYSDVEGRREQHLPRPFAYRYRDYVIQAFNADKPYDRFLLEQIAGDELADYAHNPTITQEIYDNLVATGFLRMGPDPTWANITGFVPDRLEVISDAIDVFGSGVLGLTLKCARCHDHKFDPIPQRDYYRLADLFKGAYDEYNWLKPDLRPYGGAVNVGKLGERSLPFVLPEERKTWEAHQQKDKKIPQPRVAALWDRGDPSPTYIYRRGEYERTSAWVKGGVPAVLTDNYARFEVRVPWPGAETTGRRLALARWLTNPKHPLTSRVFVNRIWRHHFGHGLVKSLGNFGRTGALPTHPELLDWLANEFVRDGCRMKPLHRLILTSRTYRQSSAVSAGLLNADPDNELFSRVPLRRLEAEALWDSLVSVSGRLVEVRFGPPVPVEVRTNGVVLPGKAGGGWRRSIYGQQLRKDLPTVMDVFDAPAMNPNCLERSESISAPQALHLTNDETLRELATSFAHRVRVEAGSEPGRQIERAFLIAFARAPSEDEQSAALQTLQQLQAAWIELRTQHGLRNAGKDDEMLSRSRGALTTFCHALLNSAEFLYVD